MSIFETTAPNDSLGLWDFSPQSVSFALGDEPPDSPEPGVLVYSVNLPADAEASSRALAEQESRFARIDSALDSVPARLEDLVIRMQAVRPEAGGGVSFAVPVSEADSTPEGELLALLADSDSAARSGTGLDGVSFGLSDVASEAFGEAKARFDAFLEQINHEVLHFAWVETKVAEQLIARTELDWSGKSITIWVEDVSSIQKTLHQRALNVTTRTRHVKMRLFATVASGAAKVAVLTAAGTPALALPAVYQYVIKIVSQVKELQTIQIS